MVWESIVAMATPATPQPKLMTNQRSSAMFKPLAKSRKPRAETCVGTIMTIMMMVASVMRSLYQTAGAPDRGCRSKRRMCDKLFFQLSSQMLTTSPVRGAWMNSPSPM